MPVNVMSDFMGKHDFDFFGRELIHQRVAQQNPAGSTHAGQSGVRLTRLSAKMKAVDSLDGQSSARHQALQPLQQRRIVDGSDFVKKRQD